MRNAKYSRTCCLSSLILAVLMAALLLAPATVPAAGYLKIGNIRGEATDAGHRDWIDVVAVSQPVSRSVPGASGSSRSQVSITVTKPADSASASIMNAMAMGTTFDEVRIDFFDSGGRKIYTLKKATITSVVPTVDPKTGARIEQVTLAAEELR